MNLSEATQMMEFRKQPRVTAEEKITASAITVAERVFEISAAFGEPYYANTPLGWARKWLASKKFVLMEIAPHHVAVPNANRLNPDKITKTLQAAGETQIDPIVVDVNKLGVGQTTGGYIPKVIVVDGKHRHRVQVMQGRDRIMAWVGELAIEEMKAREPQKKITVQASIQTFIPGTKMSSTAQLYATGGAAGGSGAGSSGQNPERMGVYADDEDDEDTEQKKMGSPEVESPGSGVGPRLKPNTGAKQSEFSRKKDLFSGPIRVKKIVTKDKKKEKLEAQGSSDSVKKSWNSRTRSASTVRDAHIALMQKKGYKLLHKSKFPNGTLTHEMKKQSGRTMRYQTVPNETGGNRVTTQHYSE